MAVWGNVSCFFYLLMQWERKWFPVILGDFLLVYGDLIWISPQCPFPPPMSDVNRKAGWCNREQLTSAEKSVEEKPVGMHMEDCS